jgi:hypothetical protein
MRTVRRIVAVVFAALLSFSSIPAVMGASNPLPVEITQASTLQSDLKDITYDGRGTYVAVGDNGVILTSSDSKQWQLVKTLVTTNLTAVATDGKQFVIVGEKGVILQSSDGKTWSRQTVQKLSTSPKPVPNFTLTDVYWDGEKFIAVASGAGNTAIGTSKNGATWTPFKPIKVVTRNGKPSFSTGANAIVKSQTGYLIASYAGIFRSTDLNTWIYEPVKGDLFDIACRSNVCVAVGYDPMAIKLGSRDKARMTGIVYYSSNGRDWKEIRHEKKFYIADVAKSKINYDFNGFIYLYLHSIVWGDGRFMAAGIYGTTTHSKDGKDWNISPNILQKAYSNKYFPLFYDKKAGGDADINRMIWDGKRYVAVGNRGTILTSYDAADWSLSLPYSKPYTVNKVGETFWITASSEWQDLNDLLEKAADTDADVLVCQIDSDGFILEDNGEPTFADFDTHFKSKSEYVPIKQWRQALDAAIDKTVHGPYHPKMSDEEIADLKRRVKVRTIILQDTDERMEQFIKNYLK